ncbi:HAD family hydrolase, partial [Actinomadura adrarensis]
MLGLPDEARACLFDLDGVLTRTAAVHAAAWKEMFDGFLRAHAERTGEAFVPFDVVKDYGPYVDGKRREDGTRSFLQSRGITLPEGDPDDPPDAETVRGLGNRKNALVLKLIDEKGVETFEGSIEYVRKARAAGLKTAVVSSSANTPQVLRVVGITDLFDARVDGV